MGFSFRKYVAEELLTGDNQYYAGDTHGKQDARKVRFLRHDAYMCDTHAAIRINNVVIINKNIFLINLNFILRI